MGLNSRFRTAASTTTRRMRTRTTTTTTTTTAAGTTTRRMRITKTTTTAASITIITKTASTASCSNGSLKQFDRVTSLDVAGYEVTQSNKRSSSKAVDMSFFLLRK